VRTIEDTMAAMTAIVDGAVDRSLTDDEVAEYEALEAELATVRRDGELRARQTAYATPVAGAHLHVGTPRPDEGLDRAFENYLRTGQPNADIAGLAVRNEQGVGTSAGGGYLVPAGFRQKLVEVRQAFGGFAPHADGFTTDTGNPVEYPTLDDTDNQGDITAENAVFADGDDLVFGTVRLGAYKYTSQGTGTGLPLRVSVELLQDAAFDVAGLVARALGTRIARKQAAHWLTGTGVSQPQGLVNTGLTADNELDTPDAVDYDDLMDTYDLLDPAYEQNAQWLMKKNTWSLIRGIVDGASRPIIQEQNQGIDGMPALRLLGFPVIIDQGMPTLSSAADGNAIAFGDFREAYVIRRVSNLAVVVNPYSRANYGQVEYVAWERADGVIQNRAAYIITQNNT
jgi:HK97 family phage major capsid protein